MCRSPRTISHGRPDAADTGVASGRRPVAREVIKSDEAPAAIGPYSQAVKAEGCVFLSRQLAPDPRPGQMVGQDIKTQTRRVLGNIKVVLKAAGSSLDKVVRCGVFLKD